MGENILIDPSMFAQFICVTLVHILNSVKIVLEILSFS